MEYKKISLKSTPADLEKIHPVSDGLFHENLLNDCL